MKIGFKNFKKFKNFPMIELAPITFLVGPNNSGKSSFIKALTFLFSNLTNHKKCSKIYPPFIESVSFHQNSASNFEWGDFSTTLHRGTNNDITFVWEIRGIVISFSFGATENDIKLDPTLLTTLPIKSFSFKYDERGVNIENFYCNGEWETCAKVAVDNFIKWLRDAIKLLRGRIEKYRSILNPSRSSHKIERFEMECNNYIEALNSIEDLKYDFIETNFDAIKDDALNRSLYQYCMNSLKLLGHRNESPLIAPYFEYIETHNAPHTISIPANDKNSFLSRTVAEFNSAVSREKHRELYAWINEWLQEFEIGDYFDINTHFGGEILTVEIGHVSECVKAVFGGNGLMPLGTLGTGAIQLFVLLLKIATVWSKLDDDMSITIIIEEPEQNLHPKFQSKLADLFKEVNEKTQGRVRFVIETHSEYLIRRTQVIVAEQHYTDGSKLAEQNPFKVYYFPEEGLPYDMEYQTSGRFENRFGDGFFDESSIQSILIAKIERDRKNGIQ